MSNADKITSRHRERLAVVYVRQSTLRQVRENRESTDRQYGLQERARALGWPAERIVTIDADLGVSGAQPGVRKGFERLKAEVAHGRVGAVLGLEVSRLARNAVDWFQLLDSCRTTDTLLIEDEQVYAPARHDDSLVLAIKGSLSESENFLIRARLRGGAVNKAARGEMYHHLPVGFLREGNRVIKDPDERIQHAIETVFQRFQEHGSARQATCMLREDGVQLPSRRHTSAAVEWAEATYSRVVTILHNPMMGGAYAYGRFRKRRMLDANDQLRQVTRRVARADWQVLIEDHHEGYVSWQAWLEIQERMAANHQAGAVREGRALLQGLAVCGHCGRALAVKYSKAWSYHCQPPMEKTRGSCLHLGGVRIDALVEQAFLDAVAPAGVEAAREAERQLQSQAEAGLRSLRLEVERCRYDAGLAERRYRKIDPDNRLVAGTLERDWEAALHALEAARAVLQRAEQARPAVPDPARLAALGERLERLWQAPGVTARDRKRLLACLAEEVLLQIDRDAGLVRIVLRWRGGLVDEFDLPLQQRRNAPVQDDRDTVELVRCLARQYNDSETAGMLNQRGRRTARGLPFSRDRVRRLRISHDIPAFAPSAGDREAPVLSVAAAARALQTSATTLYRWIRAGLVASEQDAPGTPCRIRLTESLRRGFCDTPPAGYVPVHTAMKRLGVTRQRIWQRVRDGELEACHIRHGAVRGLYVRLGEDRQLPLLDFADEGAPAGSDAT